MISNLLSTARSKLLGFKRTNRTQLRRMTYSQPAWWSGETVAVVTGGNQGIGFEIAKILAREGLDVVFTARNAERGAQALADLRAAVPDGKLAWHLLDITDAQSVADFATFAKSEKQHVDVLINNAGMAYKGSTFGAAEARNTIDCNLKGTRRITEALLPLMPDAGRIVNVCSMAGRLSQLKSEQLRETFVNPKSADEIEQLADSFVQAIQDGNHAQQGWSNSMYGISKVAEISYTKWLARQLLPQGITVAAVCPGYCSTSMSSYRGTQSAEAGADTPVWAALGTPASEFAGKVFQARKEMTW